MTYYKKTEEIAQLSSELIKLKGNIKGLFIVRKQIYIKCPHDNKIKLYKKCHDCKHNFGNASKRDIYCIPEQERE
jgi:hypothetical protein